MALKQIKTNYHTHSTWCDGRYSTKEMILAAIEKGFTHLGFSSHAMYPFSTKHHLNPKTIQDYTNEIQSLKEDFKDKIEIFHGFEAEFIHRSLSQAMLCTKIFHQTISLVQYIIFLI